MKNHYFNLYQNKIINKHLLKNKTILKKKKKKLLFFWRYYFIKRLRIYILYKFFHILINCGKKDLAWKLLNKFFFFLNIKKYSISFLIIIISKISPVLNLKKKKVAGQNYYVPLFLLYHEQIVFGIHFFFKSINQRNEKGILNKMYSEIYDILKYPENSVSLKKKKEIYNIAINNKYFIKFL